MAQPVALLVAASLNLARRLAEEQGWRQIALDRYDGPGGHEVRAVADRSTGFLGHPIGTRVYLHSTWQLRDDWRDIEARLARGELVRHALPVLPKRR